MPDLTLDQFGPWSFDEERIVGRPDAQALAAGQKLATSRAATVSALSQDEATIEVWDSSGVWLVNVWLSDGLTYFECTCAEGRNYARNICKHKVAAANALLDVFSAPAVDDWRMTIYDLIDDKPTRRLPPSQIIAFSLMHWRGRWTIAPVTFPADVFAGVDLTNIDGVRALMRRVRLATMGRWFPNTTAQSVYVNTSDATAPACRMLRIGEVLRQTSQ